ncbi:MAG: LamG domain-containing protein [Planctomycetota bacterium]
MDSKQILLTFIVLVLGLAGAASGADSVWTNNAGDADWCEGENWNPEGVPTGSAATAIIDERSPNRGPIVGIGCNVDVGLLTGPEPNYGHTQVMDINTSGTFKIGGDWMWTMEEAFEDHGGGGTAIININGSPDVTIEGNWRGGDYGMGIINISGDPNIFVDGSIRGADMGSGSLYFTMSGGYLYMDSEFVIGDVGGGGFNMHGGTMIIGAEDGALDLGGLRGTAPIDVNMTAGYVQVPGEFRFPGSGSRRGAVFYLKGGVLDCNDFVHGQDEADNPYTDDWRMDIEQGTLKFKGDKKAIIDANVANGQITAYDGEGTVVVELIDGNTVVTALPPDPNTATNPIPPNRSRGQDPNVDLGWTSGINAAQHEIFFGTSFEDVNNMTEPCSVQDACEYDPNTLELGITYYWRIDEVNGPKTWRGRVWYFTVQSPIIDPNMLMYLKLDETDGYFAEDSSGYENHGYVDGNELGWDPNDAHPHDPPWGGSRNFSDVEDNDDPATVIDCAKFTVLNTVDDSITVSVWLKDAYNEGDDNWVFHSGVGPYQVGACVVTDDISPAGQALWRAGDDPCDILMWDLDGRKAATLEDWHLWVFLKSETEGKISIYFDGILAKEKSGTLNTLGFVQDTAFKVGSTSWENHTYMGKMDDFRVYDYALSDKQIEELFRGADVGSPWAPSPGDYAEDVPRDANISWRPGNYVQDTNGHEVFFGTDWNDVNDMTEPCSVQDACEYDPGTLKLDTTYYWRIDEVNDPCVWRGPIWRFTVADFIALDGFEQYDQGNNRIYYTWYDQRSQGDEATGAWLMLRTEPTYPVHKGGKSMEYIYDTDDGWADLNYAEAWLPLEEMAGQQDWAEAGLKLLRLFFYGDQENDTTDAEQMYVAVDDTNGLYAEIRYGDSEGEDMNDLLVEEWQSWEIPYTYFNDSNYAEVVNDVNFKSIANLYIGFGDKRNPVAAGLGGVFFDDIRLNLPICKPEYGPPYDFSGNCIVDVADVRIMGQQWLQHDVNFPDLGIQVQQPSDSNLLGHWKLDEGTGTFAEDSSTYDNHGTLETTDEGGYVWATGRIGPSGPNAVEFFGGKVKVPDSNDLKPDTNQVSVTAWVYIREDMSSGRVVVKGKNDHESYGMEVDNDDKFVFHFRDANHGDHENYEVNDVVWPDDWIHLAGTYDGTTLACYVNGQLGDIKEDVNNPYGLARCPIDDPGLAIGSEPDVNDSLFEGTIDDVRIYDYGLSPAEVAWLATEGSGEFLITAPANIIGGEAREVVNFRDYSKLMESWLDEKLWPE